MDVISDSSAIGLPETQPMGVELYFSNQLMPLADKLHDNLKPVGRGDIILTSPVVIVPNMNLSKWIKLTLARKSDIFMNVEFQYLETGLWQMIRSLDARPIPEPERWTMTSLKSCCFSSSWHRTGMHRIWNRSTIPSPVRWRDAAIIEIRCWQLAEELCRLFQEYEYHRSDMIQRWMAGDPTADAMEGCQRWIYLKMGSLKDQLGRSTGRLIQSMAEYARDVFAPGAVARTKRGHTLARYHFFGLSQISPFHLQLLSSLKSFLISTSTALTRPENTGRISRRLLKKNGSNGKRSAG
jgi:exonuclease V gamma subunit